MTLCYRCTQNAMLMCTLSCVQIKVKGNADSLFIGLSLGACIEIEKTIITSAHKVCASSVSSDFPIKVINTTINFGNACKPPTSAPTKAPTKSPTKAPTTKAPTTKAAAAKAKAKAAVAAVAIGGHTGAIIGAVIAALVVVGVLAACCCFA